MKSVLVTGGAGYIGSHTVLELLQSGYDVTVLDNLCNSSKESLIRVQNIANKPITFIDGDIRDKLLLDRVFFEHKFNAVIHFAGLKAVGESVKKPALYYENNVVGSLVLFEAMQKANVFNIVFSSSATVYGPDAPVPYMETHKTGVPTSPYGKTKLMIEQILQDYCKADDRWSVAILRYFNPIGAHQSGLIGEDPNGIPNNLLPYISQVAIGKLEMLSVYGNDYDTQDGTCERDYIHVVDLARGHVVALDYIKSAVNGSYIWNLGSGKGHSVLAIIKAFECAAATKVAFKVSARREGDIGAFWADASKAKEELNWQTEFSISDMMQDTWRWQKNNPNGYA